MVTCGYRTPRKDLDVYRYFEGGREGVKRRVGEAVEQQLQFLSESAVSNICRDYGIENIAREIRDGNYSHACRHVFSAFSLPLELDLSKTIGEPQFCREEEPELMDFMQKAGFLTTYLHDNSASRIREFLVMKAWVDLNECHHEPPKRMDPNKIKKYREKFRQILESSQL